MPVLQKDCDYTDPEQHFLWAFRELPFAASVPMIVQPSFLTEWSKHFWECGFAHRDYLADLADDDGYIHVSQLPAQTKKYLPPHRGPQHQYNASGQWVPADTVPPKPIVLPDITKYTAEENAAILYQYAAAGMLPLPAEERDTAQEWN